MEGKPPNDPERFFADVERTVASAEELTAADKKLFHDAAEKVRRRDPSADQPLESFVVDGVLQEVATACTFEDMTRIADALHAKAAFWNISAGRWNALVEVARSHPNPTLKTSF